MRPAVAALGITFTIQAALAAGVYAPPVLAALAERDIGVPASAVGLFTALVYLAATVSSFFSGLLIARWGPVRLSQLCLAASACGLAALATGSVPLILLGAILLGLSYGPATPAGSQILVACTPVRLRATIFSLKQTGVPAGGIAVGALLPALALLYGWRSGALLLAVLCALLALACERVRDLDRDMARLGAGRRDVLEPLRLAWKHRTLGRLSIVAFLYSGVQLCYASYLVVYLVSAAGVSVVVAGAGISAFMVGGIVGRVAWGALADRTRRGRSVLAGLGIATGIMALTLATVSPHWTTMQVLAACVVAGLAAIAWNGVQLAEVAAHAPDGRIAAATGMSMMFSYLGVVVVPLLFWLLYTATASYPAGFVFTALLSFVGAGVLLRREFS
jgi:MFS family permease